MQSSRMLDTFLNYLYGESNRSEILTCSAWAILSKLSIVGEYFSIIILWIVVLGIPVVSDNCRTDTFFSYMIFASNIFIKVLFAENYYLFSEGEKSMKNVFSIFCFSIGCFVFSNTVYAENIIPYSDSVISFSYDSDFNGRISRCDLPSNYSLSVEYRADFDTYSDVHSPDGHFLVRICSIQKCSELYDNWKDIVPLSPDMLEGCESVDVISNGDLPETLIHMNSSDNGKYVFYRKLLGYNDKYLAIADYQLSSIDSDDDSLFETLYNSVQVTDEFLKKWFCPFREL